MDKAFDRSVSFMGIANMCDLAREGISEGNRVSKHGLINLGIVISDGNPMVDEINKELRGSGYDISINSCKETNFMNMHKIDSKLIVEVENVFKGIAVTLCDRKRLINKSVHKNVSIFIQIAWGSI